MAALGTTPPVPEPSARSPRLASYGRLALAPARLRCSKCGSRDTDVVVSGYSRRINGWGLRLCSWRHRSSSRAKPSRPARCRGPASNGCCQTAWVKFGVKDGVGCDPKSYANHHFTEEELSGKPQPDQHWHEHATCFRRHRERFLLPPGRDLGRVFPAGADPLRYAIIWVTQSR